MRRSTNLQLCIDVTLYPGERPRFKEAFADWFFFLCLTGSFCVASLEKKFKIGQMTSMLSETKCQINTFTGISVNCFLSVCPRILLAKQTPFKKISDEKSVQYCFNMVSHLFLDLMFHL